MRAAVVRAPDEVQVESVPEPKPRLRKERALLQGDVASPMRIPPGCPFHPRCFHPRKDARCTRELPILRPVGATVVACHYAEDTPLEAPAG